MGLGPHRWSALGSLAENGRGGAVFPFLGRLSKTAAEHGLRKYLSSLTSVRGANIQVPDRFSGAGWSRTYFARRGIIAGEARFGLGRARMETFCAALHGNGLT